MNKNIRNMIFHIPIKIDINWYSGSQIRPQKMIQAFKEIGYNVELVMGCIKERKVQINQIKQNISNGIKYEFLYSETSTMPTALTESHHLPVSPFFDFDFLRYCKSYDIKIGLYYRDIYWKLESYKNEVPFFKRKLAEFFYNYDLTQYKEFVDIFYVPSLEMYEFMKYNFSNKVISLPPGIDEKENYSDIKISSDTLDFIYVGGTGENYNLELFLSVISDLKKVNFTLCTREKEWLFNYDKYSNILNNTTVYHKSGSELDKLYNNSDIAIYFIQPNLFGSFALGLKLFEYMSNLKPIIAVKGTAIGNFVKKYDIGWVIDYSKNDLNNLITELIHNKDDIKNKILNIQKILPNNTWNARALQVKKELTSFINE